MGIFPGSCWAGPGLRSGSPCRHKCLPGTCLSPVHVQPQPFRGKGFCFSIQHCWDSAWVFFFLMKQKCCPDRISLPKILKPLGFSSQLLLKADSLTLCSDSSHVLLSFLMVFFPNVYPNPLGNPTPLDPYGWILGKTLQAQTSSLSQLCLSLRIASWSRGTKKSMLGLIMHFSLFYWHFNISGLWFK